VREERNERKRRKKKCEEKLFAFEEIKKVYILTATASQ
jgi:hypothetical protein